MKYKITTGSILDFPRKTLPEDLWDYENKEDLPHLKTDLRNLVMKHAKKAAQSIGLPLIDVRLLGGAASYQWSKGTDIDIQLYVKWPENTEDNEVLDKRRDIYKTELEYKGYPITFYLKGPKEFANATEEYDVTENEWTLPPLVLPKGFDPETYFAPLIKVAENRARKFDGWIGELRRAWYDLKKDSEAKDTARDLDVVEKNVEGSKQEIKEIVEKIARNFATARQSRRDMYNDLRSKLAQDVEIGRFERFQEPEIVWKYLDRSGYMDYLYQLHDIVKKDLLDDILARY